jgi:hypothetical protein
VVAVALAASAALDPLKLALQRSDMPPTVENAILGPPKPHPEDPEGLLSHGKGLKGANFAYSWPGGKNKPGLADWHLEGKVIVAPSTAAAQKLYQDATKLKFGLLDLLYPPQHQVQLSLPRYGDEQLAVFGTTDDTEATVFARTGKVVWGLHVFHSPLQWKVSNKQVVDQLRIYAGKQAARIGQG